MSIWINIYIHIDIYKYRAFITHLVVWINLERVKIVKQMICSCDQCGDSSKFFEELQDLGNNLKFNQSFIDLSIFASAISSKERLIIINILKDRDRCVCELEAILDKSQSTISHHLRKLESTGLVGSYKKGNFSYYHLISEKLNKYLESFRQVF